MGSKLTRNFATQEELEKIGILDAELFDSVVAALPTNTPYNADGVAISDGDRVLFSNLAVGNNRRYQASIVATDITWTDLDNKELIDDQKILVDKGAVNQNNFVQIQGGVWKIANEGVNPAAGEANTNTNSGAGGAGIVDLVKAKVGVDTPIRRLQQGANVILTQNADTITIAAAAGAGEANTNTNAGVGGAGFGDWVKAKVGVDTPIRRLKQGANITITQNADDIEIAAAALGGSGFTKITLNAQLTGTFEGDVLIDGATQMTGDMTIKGNLFLANDIFQGPAQRTLTVLGSVYAATTGHRSIAMDGQNNSALGGTIFIGGDCKNVSLQANGQNGGLGSGAGGNGGTITVAGNFSFDSGGLGQIAAIGGNTGDINSNGGNGGTIKIGGNAILSALSAKGGANTITGANVAGNGGTILILGNCVVDGVVEYFGGHVSNGNNGGDGGTMTVEGDLYCVSTLNCQGGNNLSANASLTGAGGFLNVSGNCHFFTGGEFAYRFNGGVQASTTATGNAKDGGRLRVYGNLISAGGIYLLGGTARNGGQNGKGGQVQIYGHCTVRDTVNISGGTAITNPSTAAAVTWGTGSFFYGGCNVEDFVAEDSDGTAITTLAIMEIVGHCIFGDVIMENRVGSQLRARINYSTMIVANSFLPKTTLNAFNGAASGAFTPLNEIAYSSGGGSWRRISNDGVL